MLDSSPEYKASEFGLIPGNAQDATLCVVRALEACRKNRKTVLRFAPGQYHFFAQCAHEAFVWISNNTEGLKRIAFPLYDFDDLTIDGQGAEFVFHGAITPFVIARSQNITLRDFTIDWAHPVTLQGQIVSVAGHLVEIAIPAECNYCVEDGRAFLRHEGDETGTNGFIELDAVTLAPAYHTGDCWRNGWEKTFEEAGPHRLRFTLPVDRHPAVGNHLVFLRANRCNPAIVITEAARVAIHSVTVYRAPAMALVAQRTTDVSLHNFNVQLKPGTDRVVTATADATHFVGCRGVVQMTDCLFEGQMDDATNVHGVYLRVGARFSETELLLQRRHVEQKGAPVIGAGDSVQILAAGTLERLGENRAVSVREVNAQDILVAFAEGLPDSVQSGTILENLTWTPDVIIRNCTARRNRARFPPFHAGPRSD